MARFIGATVLANEASEVKTNDLIGLKFQNETVCDRERFPNPARRPYLVLSRRQACLANFLSTVRMARQRLILVT
jgi:hypothetical protein